MIGLSEFIFILILVGSLYFLLKPPIWYERSKRNSFINQYGGIAKQKELQALVSNVGHSFARAANYPEKALEFQILKSPIPNAFAWNTKTIYMTMGLLKLTEGKDELAAVLAHEVGHLVAEHSKARATNRAKFMVLSSALSGMGWMMGRAVSFISRAGEAAYSREQEREADRLAISYLQSAGYDSGAAIRVLKKLHRQRMTKGESENPLQEILATHPVDEERIATVQSLVSG